MPRFSCLYAVMLCSIPALATGFVSPDPAQFVPRVSDGLDVTEWEEWSFADKDWWADVGGQSRSLFTKGSGTVAVSDPDEWSDIGDLETMGLYSSFLQTPTIALKGAAADSLVFQFDSSWRPEDTQASNLVVSYDGGSPVEVINWSSDPGSLDFKDSSENETVVLNLSNPAGANDVMLTFGMYNAANDWWWAIDNIIMSADVGTLLTEDFESLSLGPSVDERIPADDVFTQAPPDGWMILSGSDVGIPTQLQDTPHGGRKPHFEPWTMKPRHETRFH